MPSLSLCLINNRLLFTRCMTMMHWLILFLKFLSLYIFLFFFMCIYFFYLMMTSSLRAPFNYSIFYRYLGLRDITCISSILVFLWIQYFCIFPPLLHLLVSLTFWYTATSFLQGLLLRMRSTRLRETSSDTWNLARTNIWGFTFRLWRKRHIDIRTWGVYWSVVDSWFLVTFFFMRLFLVRRRIFDFRIRYLFMRSIFFL